ncbi:MAG TPA: ATP-binding protein, partial [Candidatus Thermoplasmatota archaeon]|nr:ATP-binding protein [Candidatus Thermoplasmatota archaeon]
TQILSDHARAEPARAVAWHVEPGLACEGDELLLRTLLLNLLGNAWKFTSNVPAPLIEVTRAGDGRAICVRDNGAGFDMAYAAKLFRPFERLHTAAQFEGTGIGLATVQRIVERHGGRVWAEGRPGHGAAFYFTLEPERETAKL